MDEPLVPASDVTLTPYDPRWEGRAESLIRSLQQRLGPHLVSAEHIGSTAIPGMAAKDVLDIQVSVEDLDDAAQAFARPMSLLGFELLPYRHDHVPAGRDDPQRLWEKRSFARRGHVDGDVNLHIRRVGSPNERLALLFRDWLRAHPAAVPVYARFKISLSARVPDLEGYTEIKDPVVDVVGVAAEVWAAATDWRPESGSGAGL